MLILLDIGNTSVTYGLYQNGRWQGFGSRLIDDIPKFINKCCKSGAEYHPYNLVISSVVPKNTLIIKKTLAKKPGIRLWIAGKNLPVPIRHRYKWPEKLGIDRRVNVYGALQLYKPPLLIIDFGTAITADYISKKGVFEGGMIIPGPEISFQSLIERAALLPKKIRLPEKALSFIGRSTY